MKNFIDMTGWIMAEHGVPESRLTVVKLDHRKIKDKRTYIYWDCVCTCGNHVIVPTHRLLDTKCPTRSCGCLNKEKIQQQGLKNRKYNKWSAKLTDEHGEYYIGYTSNTNEPFYVDAQDFLTVKEYCWRVHHPSKTSPDFKVLVAYVSGANKKNIKMHQLLGCEAWDHIDHNELNNRRYNLREASQLNNIRNSKRGRNNTSGFIGVGWLASINKWRARIMVNYKEIPLGYFDNIESAIKARLKGELKYFGEFAPQRDLFEQYGISEDINE